MSEPGRGWFARATRVTPARKPRASIKPTVVIVRPSLGRLIAARPSGRPSGVLCTVIGRFTVDGTSSFFPSAGLPAYYYYYNYYIIIIMTMSWQVKIRRAGVAFGYKCVHTGRSSCRSRHPSPRKAIGQFYTRFQRPRYDFQFDRPRIELLSSLRNLLFGKNRFYQIGSGERTIVIFESLSIDPNMDFDATVR